jgi:hypothetical protein
MEAKPMIVNNISFLQSVVYWANIFIIIGLGISFVSGAMSIVSSHYLNKAKDEQFEVYKSDTNVKISIANTTAALANAEAAKATAEAAKANARAEEAKLALVKFRTPRRIPGEMRKKYFSNLSEFSGSHFILTASTNESIIFAKEIGDTLVENGWNRKDWPERNYWNLPNTPYKIGNVVTNGVHIQIFDPSTSKARDALVNALSTAGFELVVGSLEKGILADDPDRKIILINVGPLL